MLKKIAIKYVKGISDLSLDVDLPPNKPAIFVAPNGFGKTSVTTAFRSLNRNRLLLAEEHFHNGLATNHPELMVELVDDGGSVIVLKANESQNQLSAIFDIEAVGSLAYPKATKRNTGRFTAVSASSVIDPIVLVSSIPPKKTFNYTHKVGKQAMLCLEKVAPNIGFLKEHESFFANALDEGVIDAIGKTAQLRQKKKIDDFFERMEEIVNVHPPEKILEIIETTELEHLREIQQLKIVADYISNFDFCTNETFSYLVALELSALFRLSCDELTSICIYANYAAQKKDLIQIFNDFNSSSQNFSPKEQKGSLMINFPKLDQISNGQRDVLSFVAELQRIKRGFKKQALILFIDEVFDYLDEANLVAAQFYLSKFITETKDAGKKIYPVIMTHLPPELFCGYVFGRKQKLHIRYLKKFPQVTSDSMKALLRERANKDSPLKPVIENKLLHFHSEGINHRAEFAAANLKPTWGEPNVFFQYICNELTKYSSNCSDYEPVAVCCAVRVKIEKLIYEKITGAENKRKFLDEIVSGTNDKLDFAAEVGVQVPETFYLLGIIYNEGLHWREDNSFTSKVVARLENATIRHMIVSLTKT